MAYLPTLIRPQKLNITHDVNAEDNDVAFHVAVRPCERARVQFSHEKLAVFHKFALLWPLCNVIAWYNCFIFLVLVFLPTYPKNSFVVSVCHVHSYNQNTHYT